MGISFHWRIQPVILVSEDGRSANQRAGAYALRLGRFFGMEAQFWMNLQARYDLETTREALADRLDQEVQVHVA